MAVKAGKMVDVIHRLIQEVKFLRNHVREDIIGAFSAPRVIQAGEDLIKELTKMNNEPNSNNTTQQTPAAVWVLWVQGKGGPTVRHQSYTSAANEARRLIEQDPSRKVDIFRLIETAQTTKPPIEFVDAGTGVKRYAA